MTTTISSPRQTIERFLQAAVSPQPGDIADCYADHVVIEMPFASGLTPGRIETTREELRARFAAGRAVRHYTRVYDVRIHETTDPVVLVAEYRMDGRLVSDASPFSMNFVMVLQFRDGLIAAARDYSDPIAGARALGRLPELAAMLAADSAG
ncbi:MAG TPA: nuclear transport factor 2 family protein [Streptosporangiaceae bacterium]|nr:nuclear transport factor 2 family protein [Streptosporangiaceae bacterium]